LTVRLRSGHPGPIYTPTATDALPHNQHKDGALMITLTRLSGSVFALNSDLVERVDSTPDTVITLVDGTKYVVCESLGQVVDSIRHYRGAVIAIGARLTDGPAQATESPAPPRLSAVTSGHQDR
jgi:flagellar protein FlbD